MIAAESKVASAPLSDAIIVAAAQLVDDAQVGRRDPSHWDLGLCVQRAGLEIADPKSEGQSPGKAKRVSAILNWAMDNDPVAGGEFVYSLVSSVQGHGGFREASANYVGRDPIANLVSAFESEGYELSTDGHLRPKILDNLSGVALTEALNGYVRRAKRGVQDAALVTGTGKDLLEAVCSHILEQRYGNYSGTSNFPTLLGRVFVELGLTTPQNPVQPGESPNKRIERALYELACGVNQLRNKQGTGHGRPWLPTVTDSQARMAVEAMGMIAERLLLLEQGVQ
jgi:hypothetical protein